MTHLPLHPPLLRIHLQIFHLLFLLILFFRTVNQQHLPCHLAFQSPPLIPPMLLFFVVEEEFVAFEACFDLELIRARGSRNFLCQLDIFGVADCQSLDPHHLAQCLRYARVHIDCRIREHFLRKVEIRIAQIPYITTVDAREVDGEGSEILVRGEETECSNYEADGPRLELSDDDDELVAVVLYLVLLRVLHVFDTFKYTVYVSSSGFYGHTICPSDLQVADGATIALTDVEEPVEYIVVVFSVEDDFIGAIEDVCSFFVDGAACSEEGSVGRFFSRGLTVVDQAFLPGVGSPVIWRAIVVIVFRLAR